MPSRTLLGWVRPLLACGLLLGSTAVVSAEEWQAHEQRAQRALALGHYDDALLSFSEAYGSGGPKELLLEIGQIYIRLGQPKEARTACQSYLLLVKDAAGQRKATADRCIADAAQTAQRPRVPPPLHQDAPNLPPAPQSSVPPPPAVVAAPPPVPPPAAVPPPAWSARAGGRGKATTTTLVIASPTTPPPPAVMVPPPPPPAVVPPPSAPPMYGQPSYGQPVSSPAPAPGEPLPPLPISPPSGAVGDGTTAAPNPFVEYDACLRAQRSGNATEARDCYLRFLPRALREGGIAEANIAPIVTQLTRFPAPATIYPTPPPILASKIGRNDGMWGAGLSMWLCAMIPTWVFAPLYVSNLNGAPEVYYPLMIPVVGPFISGALAIGTTSGSSRRDIAINYAVPWMVADGITQLVGFALFASGVQTRKLEAHVTTAVADFHVKPYATGEGLGFVGTF